MKENMDLTPEQIEEVTHILSRYLPPSAEVWVFGSRATGRATRASDLDLALSLGRPVTLAERGDLENAFSESRLPMKVDLVDMTTVNPVFAQRIVQTGKRLTR